MYLDDISVENGATMFLRGSHKWSADEHAAFQQRIGQGHEDIDSLDVDVAPGVQTDGACLSLQAACQIHALDMDVAPGVQADGACMLL